MITEVISGGCREKHNCDGAWCVCWQCSISAPGGWLDGWSDYTYSLNYTNVLYKHMHNIFL